MEPTNQPIRTGGDLPTNAHAMSQNQPIGGGRTPEIVGVGAFGAVTVGTDVPVRAPMWMEVCVIGGLGLAVYIGPPIYYGIRERVQACWPRMSRSARGLMNRVLLKLEPMKRRRRNGSLIRVVADLFPNFFFGPTPRIFIAGLKPINSTAGSLATFRVGSPSHDKIMDESPLGPQGMIVVAFELDGDGESECTEIVDDIHIEEDACSNPEGWDADPTFAFDPRAHSTATIKCSTPTPNLPDICSQKNVLNDSVCTDVTDYDDNNGKTREEIADLKMIIQGLVHQMSVLNQNMTIRNQAADSFHHDLPPPPPLPTNNVLSDLLSPLPPPPPTFAQVVIKSTNQGGLPPPPPPPPPPMPGMVFQGSAPIKITKSKNQELPKVAPSMMDVLKGLNSVKLKSVCRSPGGTPVKDQKKRASDKNSLEYALKKRFESMHTPPGSDNDDSADKENEFEDSFLKSVTSPRKGRKRNSGTLKSANLLTERNSANKTNGLPPGPHLLKKRIQN